MRSRSALSQRRELAQGRKMGGSKKPIVGYENDLGIHFVLSLGPIDALLKVMIDKLTAWEGTISSGRFFIDKRELFGGRDREGGVSGFLDFLPGFPDQPKNDYLQRLAGTSVIPAYRGLASVVARQIYIGNNPYLKPWSFKVQRVFTGYDGAPQWYPEKAGIFRGWRATDSAIYIALDGSGSMAGSRWENMIAAVTGFLQEVKAAQATDAQRNDIRVVIWSDTVLSDLLYRNCTQEQYDELIFFLNELDPGEGGGTDFGQAVSLAPDFFLGTGPDVFAGGFVGSIGKLGTGLSSFFGVGGSKAKRRVVMLVTDGIPSPVGSVDVAADTLDSLANVEVYAFNIDEPDTTYTSIIDNTATDGVPVVTGGDPEPLLRVMRQAFSLGYDMNPAHILREVLIDPDTGGSGDASEIDEAVFTAAADTLYDEAFGLSFYWRNLGTRQDFIQLVEQHIDGKLYQDRQSGLWGLKLLRPDYDVDEIPSFGRADIVEWESVQWPDPYELPNYVTVIYSDTTKDEDGAIPLGNPARIQQVGGKINARKIELKGIHNAELAARCAARDLAALSAPLLSGSVVLRYFPATINRGDAIKISDESIGIVDVVCRVLEIEDGDGRDNAVRVQLIEDRFGRALSGLVAVEPPAPIADLPKESSPRFVEEAPFYSIVQELGQAQAESTLQAQPFAGFALVTGRSPYPATVNALYNVDAGTGWEQNGFVDFSPVLTLRSRLSRDPTQQKAFVDYAFEISDVRVGSLAYINGELVSVISIDVAGTSSPGDYWHPPVAPPGPVVLIEFGRGCLDTVPSPHFEDEAVIFWLDFASGDGVQYLSGETISIKLQPFGPEGTLDFDVAPVDFLTFNNRAVRPYPAGNLQVNGSYTDLELAWPLNVTWAHRDRLLQTTAVFDDYTQGDVGPEAGTTYTVRLTSVDVNQVTIETNLELTGLTGTTQVIDEVDLATPLAPETAMLFLEVISERDGFTSWTSSYVELRIFLAPFGLSGSEGAGVVLFWADPNTGAVQEDEQRIYRSTSPMDPDALPSPLATVDPDVTIYADATIAPATTYFYRVSAVRGLVEKVSEEFEITTSP